MNDLTNAERQLLVIGNGFDLFCGLKSSYRDFINWRRKHLAEEDGVCEQNVWDAVLEARRMQDPQWCDIESAIASWAGGEGSEAYEMLNPSVRIINLRGDSPRRLPNRDEFRLVANAIGVDEALDTEQHFTYLFTALRQLEDSFIYYMKESLRRCDEYQLRARATVQELLCEEDGTRNKTIHNTLLNFNYTEPVPPSEFSNLCIDRVRNVHGELGCGEAIFGIDGMNRMDDRLALPFTKTYRLMRLNKSNHSEMSRKGLGLSDHVSRIKFFGHSLAEADHSYFQAIFDTVDLYGSDTCLEFYYVQYGEKSVVDVRQEQIDRIMGLLERYSKSLDNEYHGKNLIHKLLLEDRLKLRLLDVKSYL